VIVGEKEDPPLILGKAPEAITQTRFLDPRERFLRTFGGNGHKERFEIRILRRHETSLTPKNVDRTVMGNGENPCPDPATSDVVVFASSPEVDERILQGFLGKLFLWEHTTQEAEELRGEQIVKAFEALGVATPTGEERLAKRFVVLFRRRKPGGVGRGGHGRRRVQERSKSGSGKRKRAAPDCQDL
jgi:hypothetical protein